MLYRQSDHHNKKYALLLHVEDLWIWSYEHNKIKQKNKHKNLQPP